MALKFKDYYEILGVARDATTEQIQKAFRELARRFHPDVSKEKNAAERFKEASEAYEVLKDDDKRKRYDALGANWQQGQDFTPPPGFEGGQFEFRDGSGAPADFSEFFASMFGRGGFRGFEGFGDSAGTHRAARGHDVQAELPLSLEDLKRGGQTSVKLRSEDGAVRELTVKIPPGTTQGTKIRLARQGAEGRGGGPAGDLFLRVRVEPDLRFELEGTDLRTAVDISAWEAALGATIDLTTLDGVVALKVPSGASSEQTLRLRGLGLPRNGSERGDLLCKLHIVVPRELSDDERRLFEELREKSHFHPRG